MPEARILKLSRSLLEDLLARARRQAPEETCGFLLGARDSTGAKVQSVAEVPNQVRSNPEENFRISPQDLFRVGQEAEQEQLELLGVWHSHPSSGATPSAADHQGTWPQWSNLILGNLTQATPGVRSFLWQPTGWIEESVEIFEPGSKETP